MARTKRKTNALKHNEQGVISKVETYDTYGSGYKKKSALKTEVTTFKDEPAGLEAFGKELDFETAESKLNFLDAKIKSWADQNHLPTKDHCVKNEHGMPDYKALYLLIRDYEVKGSREASNVLFDLKRCLIHSSNSEFEKAFNGAIDLVFSYSKFLYSINESKLSLGNFRHEEMLNHERALSESDWEKIEQFLTTEWNSKKNKLRTKGKLWDLGVKFVSSELDKEISAQTIRKRLSKKIVW